MDDDRYDNRPRSRDSRDSRDRDSRDSRDRDYYPRRGGRGYRGRGGGRNYYNKRDSKIYLLFFRIIQDRVHFIFHIIAFIHITVFFRLL